MGDEQTLLLLKDIAEALNEANDISEAMRAILPRLSGALGLSTAWAFRYDPGGSAFVEVGASGLPPALAKGEAAALKGGWCECQDRFCTGRLHRAVNIVRCSRLAAAEGDRQGLVYHASVPLRSKGQPLGILNVAAAGEKVFTQPALDLLTAIGHQVAVAVDRAGLLSRERKRARRLRAVSAIASELVALIEPRQILQRAAARFVEALGAPACGVVRNQAGEAAGSGRVLVAASYARPEEPEVYSYASDAEQPVLPDEERVLLSDARSRITVPIPHSEYEVCIESPVPAAFDETDADLLAAFAGHLAAALENARLYQQSLASARWSERRQLAADLHDAVSQRLFSATLLARSAGLFLQQGRTNEASQAIQRVQELIGEGQEEMRALIETLRPREDGDLLSLLREKIEPLQLQGETRIHLTGDDAPETTGAGVTPVFLGFEAREALLAVVGEALHNVLRHAGARNAWVSVTEDGGLVRVAVRDDGQGFDEHTVARGIGTTSMFERVRAVGGRVRIESVPGRGTLVICELPVGNDPAASALQPRGLS